MEPHFSYWSWDEPCWWRQVNFITIQIDIHTHIPYIIRYDMLNGTDQSWFLLSQLVGGITDCESVTIHQRKNYFGRETEGSSSLQRNFTWLILKKSCYWIINHLKCNFPFFLTFKLPCLTSAGYPRSSRFSKRVSLGFLVAEPLFSFFLTS